MTEIALVYGTEGHVCTTLYIFSNHLYCNTRAANLVSLVLITLIGEIICALLNILPHSKVQTQNTAKESHI